MDLNLKDSRIAAGLVGLGLVCLTVLVAMGKLTTGDAAGYASALLYGAAAAWNAGRPAVPEPNDPESN